MVDVPALHQSLVRPYRCGAPLLSILAILLLQMSHAALAPAAGATNSPSSTTALVANPARFSGQTIDLTAEIATRDRIAELSGDIVHWLTISDTTTEIPVITNDAFLYETGLEVHVVGTVLTSNFASLPHDIYIDARNGSVAPVQQSLDLRSIISDFFLPEQDVVPTSSPHTPWSLMVDFSALAAALFAFLGFLFTLRAQSRKARLGMFIFPHGTLLERADDNRGEENHTLRVLVSLLLVPTGVLRPQIAPGMISLKLNRYPCTIVTVSTNGAGTLQAHEVRGVGENTVLWIKADVDVRKVPHAQTCRVEINDALSGKAFKKKFHVSCPWEGRSTECGRQGENRR